MTSERLRGRVARNTSTPPEVLGRLAGDLESNVHWGVAENARLLLEDLL